MTCPSLLLDVPCPLCELPLELDVRLVSRGVVDGMLTVEIVPGTLRCVRCGETSIRL